MALLRKNMRLWVRSVRLFSAEPQIPTPDSMQLMKGGGRVVPTMLLQRSSFELNKWLRNDESITQDGWIAARKELLSSMEFKITEATVDMIIVNLCLESKKIYLAMSYLQYLWDNDNVMNLSSMMTYLKLCYVRKDKDLDESEKEYLLKMYNRIRNKYPVLDATTAECCIMGITKTDRWKESFDLLDMIKILDKPRSAAYTAIICAGFENNEPEIGWKYLNEILPRLNPDHSAYIAYLDYCTRNFDGEELEKKIGKMFEFWGDRDVWPYLDVIIAYEKALETLGWSMQHTSIRELGVCRSCSHQLDSHKVTEEQFANLARTVRERVIVGEDVYRKSTPEELKKFLQFVERTQPYDVVIDGLNVSYLARSKTRPDGSQLSEIFRMCLNMGKKTLVLGRKHMLRWPKFDYDFMKRNGHVFLADDTSEDDPYMLFATLRSGPHTQFVSKDLMRQHKYLLEDPELMKTFKYWQMAHQLTPVSNKTYRGIELHLKDPPKYLPVTQKDEGGFHAPFNSDRSLQPPRIYEPPKLWVCFRKSKPSTTTKSKLP